VVPRAAVCHEFGHPLSVEEVTLDPPGEGEVRVRISACAVCHSDVAYADGAWGGTLPAVFGHEACGVVAEVGSGVTALAPGGRLVLFAGFGEQNLALVDLNLVHYQELSIVGSEWVGTPPNSRLECYRQARELLSSGELRLERLVTRRCTLDTLVEAFADVESLNALKIVLTP